MDVPGPTSAPGCQDLHKVKFKFKLKKGLAQCINGHSYFCEIISLAKIWHELQWVRPQESFKNINLPR